jgi:diguanylate cyclase (GGDEF)-like protein
MINSISARLIIGVIITLSLLMGLMVIDVLNKQHKLLTQQATQQAVDVSRVVANNALIPLLNNDLNTLRELVQNTATLTDVDMVFIVDHHGQVKASFPEIYFGQQLNDTISRRWQSQLFSGDEPKKIQYWHNKTQLDTLAPIQIDQSVVGYARILSNTTFIEQESSRLLHNVGFYAFIAVLVGGLITWLLLRGMVSQLSQLSVAAQAITQGTLQVKLPKFKGKDEIATLGKAFELMIQSLKAQIKELSYQASHDSLTKLPNRAILVDRLHQAFERSQQAKRHVAIMFIDLDHFKEVNDSYGHETGDALLIEVSAIFKKILRPIDTIVRMGGDEFCVLVEDIANLDLMSDIANTLNEQLKQPLLVNGKTVFISCSIGISLYPDDAQTPETLLRNADSAMYRAKELGRNGYQFYTSEMTHRALERVQLESEIRMAIVRQSFEVMYQPKMNSFTSHIVGLEALVRMKDQQGNTIGPNRFIPLAIETGLIVEIDRLVMRSAINQLVSWRNAGLETGLLSMNLALKQLQQPDFIPFLQSLLQETGSQADWIELEVTESEVMTDPDVIIPLLEAIRELGIALSIDDFGTGYSSLAYLKRLPITTLKIDRSFVKDLPEDHEDAAIVNAIIGLAQSFSIDTIAEGVETEAQKDFLVAAGCHRIQGYYYSKPLIAEQAEAYIRRYQA